MLASNDLRVPAEPFAWKRVLPGVSTCIGIAAAVLLFLLMTVTLIDVVGRGLFNAPLYGATEITELLLAGMSFLLYPIIAQREQHIVVDLIDSVSGPVLRVLQKLLSSLLGAFLFGVIAWRMWALGDRAVGYGDATASLRIPTAPLYYGMALLSVVTALVFIGLAIHALTQVRNGAAHAEKKELI